jgi:hypothetical protein
MHHAGVTDMAFIQQRCIIHTMQFRSIYEVTFSEQFLEDIGIKIIPLLDETMSFIPIQKIKLILTAQQSLELQSVKRLQQWATLHSLPICIHGDFRERIVPTFTEDNVEDHISIDGVPIMVLSEVVYAQQTTWHSTLLDATINSPGLDVSQHTYDEILSNMLVNKLEKYKEYSSRLESTTYHRHHAYYKWASGSIQVHPNYNFIPHFVLPVYSPAYSLLLKQGFVHTPHGLYNPTSTNLIPIYSYVNPV